MLILFSDNSMHIKLKGVIINYSKEQLFFKCLLLYSAFQKIFIIICTPVH